MASLVARGRTGGSTNSGTAFEIPATQVTQTKDGVVPEFRWLSPNFVAHRLSPRAANVAFGSGMRYEPYHAKNLVAITADRAYWL